MPQSLAKIYIHIAFSTKNREQFLSDKIICDQLHAYLSAILKAYDSPALIVNGASDHVHILCALSRKFALSEVIKELKRNSSKWIKTKGKNYSNFYWQGGYGAFSVSHSNIDQVRHYIANQEKHHKKWTFKDEFRALLEKHKIEYDERYVWD